MSQLVESTVEITSVAEMLVECPRRANKLLSFLCGTLDPHSPLRILEGKEDILRIIWSYACSEWWSLHIQPYCVPDLPYPSYYESEEPSGHPIRDPNEIPDLRNHSMFTRKKFFDCPFAVVDTDVQFPAPSGRERDSPICINMMPFDILDPKNTLPAYLHGYLPLIQKCSAYSRAHIDQKRRKESQSESQSRRDKPRKYSDPSDMRVRIAYLTVDERSVAKGHSHRRPGVHVESPGAMRSREVADKSKYTPDLSFYHPWGLGRAHDEFLEGGIFLSSNISDSTAVWNSRIHDTFGDIIGPHGSLERMRDLLGPPSKKLAARELIWLSDRTPHESLPIAASLQRQFFRLVVGEIGFWFSAHNTPNPTGFALPDWVPVVHGEKFVLSKPLPIVWECGDSDEISSAREETELRSLLYEQGVGFLADELARRGVYNLSTFVKNRAVRDAVIEDLDPAIFSENTRRFVAIAFMRICY